jgi:hypothetical protein
MSKALSIKTKQISAETVTPIRATFLFHDRPTKHSNIIEDKQWRGITLTEKTPLNDLLKSQRSMQHIRAAIPASQRPKNLTSPGSKCSRLNFVMLSIFLAVTLLPERNIITRTLFCAFHFTDYLTCIVCIHSRENFLLWSSTTAIKPAIYLDVYTIKMCAG